MNEDDQFDKWLNQANMELIESISDSLDIDGTLAAIKQHATTGRHEASPDLHAARLPGRLLDKILSLSIIRTRRPKAFTILGATAAMAVFALFTPIPGNHAPVLSFPALAENIATIVQGDGADTDGKTGYTAEGDHREPDPLQEPPLLQPTPGAPAPGQPRPDQPKFALPAPGQPTPGRPTPTEPSLVPPSRVQATTAKPAPVPPAHGEPNPAEPAPVTRSPDTPDVLTAQDVKLTTRAGQDSVAIDSWQNSDRNSNNLYMKPDGIYTRLGAKLRIVSDASDATFEDCRKIKKWKTQVKFEDLHEGSQICALSHTGRYAVLKVKTLPASTGQDGSFVFHGKTWQLPRPSPPAQPTPRQTPSPEPTPPPSTPGSPG